MFLGRLKPLQHSNVSALLIGGFCFLTVIMAVLIAGCFVILRDYIGHIFTSDP